MGNETSTFVKMLNPHECKFKIAYHSLGWSKAGVVEIFNVVIPPMGLLLPIIKFVQDNIKDNMPSNLLKLGKQIVFLTSASLAAGYFKGVYYKTATDDESKENALACQPQLWTQKVILTLMLGYHVKNYAFNREENAINVFFLNSAITTSSTALSWLLDSAFTGLYLTLVELTQEQFWIFEEIACGINSKKNPETPLVNEELIYLKQLVRHNIFDYKDDFIKSFEKAIAISDHSNIDQLIKTITWLAKSSLVTAERKQFFELPLASNRIIKN